MKYCYSNLNAIYAKGLYHKNLTFITFYRLPEMNSQANKES